jgi:phosphopantothenoylcysteine decarboxylase / phosphopantothenate---cysteine ligase
MPDKSFVLVGVCGSIAAYKSVTVVRELQRLGHEVQVVMTPAALDFVGKSTFEGITRRPAYCRMTEAADELHVTLAKGAKQFVVVAATADFLARLASGRASDLLTATALCYNAPLFVAPAMHPSMWSHPAVARNVERLQRDGVRFLGPVSGPVASGDVGMGRLMEPLDIVRELQTERDLSGKRIIVTAGPTVEDLDPVRFISNRSTGRMGYAVAAQALARGATVELVTGPVQVAAPAGARVHPVRSALDLLSALRGLCRTPTDAIVMTAAVGDYRAREQSPVKLKRALGLSLDLVENPDVIATIAAERNGRLPTLVAFALETGDDAMVIDYARKKLSQKGVDLVVANRADEALGTDTNRVHFVLPAGHTSYPNQDKHAVAEHILDFLVTRWAPA